MANDELDVDRFVVGRRVRRRRGRLRRFGDRFDVDRFVVIGGVRRKTARFGEGRGETVPEAIGAEDGKGAVRLTVKVDASVTNRREEKFARRREHQRRAENVRNETG